MNNIDYDANGNITALSQYGLKGSSSPLIDNFSYTYPSDSNQLSRVTDGANDPSTTLGDFHDGSNTGNDYTTITMAVRAYYKTSPEPEKKTSIPAEQMLTGLVQALVAPEQPVIPTHGDQLSSFSCIFRTMLTPHSDLC